MCKNLNVHNLLNNVTLKNQMCHLSFPLRNYIIDNIDYIDGAFDCFKITLFKRLDTFRQLVLLFNYLIITHAVNLDETNSSKGQVS